MSERCARCGRLLAAGAKQCAGCGAKVSASDDPQYGMRDLEAGAEVSDGSLALDDAGINARRAASSAASKGTLRMGTGDSNANVHAQANANATVAARPGAVGKAPASAAAKRTPGGAASVAGGTPGGAASVGGRTPGGAASVGGRTPGGSSTLSRSQGDAALPARTKGAAATGARAASGPLSSPVPAPERSSNTGTRRDGVARAQAAAAIEAYSVGTVIGDDPLDNSFSNDPDAPALEIDEAADPRRRFAQQAEEESAPPPLTAAQRRALKVAELAGYGPRPGKPWQMPGYWVRTTLRKRVLDAELLSLASQRKRSDDQARDQLVRLGEALYERRRAPELAVLAKQLEAVGAAQKAIGNVESQGEQRKQNLAAERAELDAGVRELEHAAAPLRQRVAELESKLEDAKARIRRHENERKKLEAEIDAASRKGAGIEAVSTLKAQRDALHGQVQTLGIDMRPLEDDLSVARRNLAVFLRKLGAIQQEQQATATALERAQQAHRLSSGNARGALRDALSSLAQAALEAQLDALLPEETQAFRQAVERADRKRAEEELHRAATYSFDAVAYKQGMYMLIGSSGLLLFMLIVRMIF